MNDFADIPESTGKTFNRPIFTKIISGYPVTLRILNQKAFRIYKHYLPKQHSSIVCLGYEYCPICQQNKRLANEHPDTPYRDVKGILPRQLRFMTNVYNRTVAKLTEDGKVFYAGLDGTFPSQDQATGEILTGIEAKPLNRIEILERGKELFTDFNNRNQMVRDEETGEPVGIWNYDVVLLASGKGTDMKISVETRPEQNDELDFSPEDLFVLELVPLQLTPDEINLALNGVSLGDIFAERKAQREIEKNDAIVNDVSQEILDEIEGELDDIFEDEEE